MFHVQRRLEFYYKGYVSRETPRFKQVYPLLMVLLSR
jgi:hypothetical protein